MNNFLDRINPVSMFNRKIKSLASLTLAEWVRNIHGEDYSSDTPQIVSYTEMIEKNAWVYASIRTIVNKTRSIQWNIIDDYNKIDVKAMDYFHERVNPVYTWNELVGYAQSWKELRGSAILRVNPDRTIDVLHMDSVDLRPDGNVFKLFYRDPETNIDAPLNMRELCIDRNYCPYASLLGLSALAPAAQMINIEYSVLNTSQNSFKNGAYIPAMLTTDQPLNLEKVTELQKRWNEKYQGTTKAGFTPVMHSGIHLEKVGLTPADYDLLKYTQVSRNLISTVIGVPGILINDMTQTDYANARKQEEVFDRYTLIPKLMQIEATFNRFLLPKLGFRSRRYNFDWELLPELQEDEKARAEAAEVRLRSGQTCQNEERDLLYKPRIQNGDTFYVPFQWNPVGMASQGLNAYNSLKKMVDRVKEIKYKTTPIKAQTLYEYHLKRMESQVVKETSELKSWCKDYFKSIKNNYLLNADKITSQGITDPKYLKSVLFDTNFKKKLSQTLHRLALSFSQQSGDAVQIDYGINGLYEANNTFIKTNTLKDAEIICEKIQNLILQEDLEQSITKNEAIALKEMEKVASQEVKRYNILGSLFSARQAGLKFKTWWSGSMETPFREWHKNMNGETVAIDAEFSNGSQAPCLKGTEEDDGCTCFISYDWEGKDGT